MNFPRCGKFGPAIDERYLGSKYLATVYMRLKYRCDMYTSGDVSRLEFNRRRLAAWVFLF
jgi:hypothetical protein